MLENETFTKCLELKEGRQIQVSFQWMSVTSFNKRIIDNFDLFFKLGTKNHVLKHLLKLHNQKKIQEDRD